jgi:hypothetical protein
VLSASLGMTEGKYLRSLSIFVNGQGGIKHADIRSSGKTKEVTMKMIINHYNFSGLVLTEKICLILQDSLQRCLTFDPMSFCQSLQKFFHRPGNPKHYSI